MSRPLPFCTLDAFTDTPYTGNPAGVVFHDGSLKGDEMQRSAGELHLECAFLCSSTSPDGDYSVAYYTGAKRIPLCGHDTVAAAMALVHTGRLKPPGSVRLVTDVGSLVIDVSERGDVTMGQALPTYGSVVPSPPIAEVLALPPAAIAETGMPAQIVSTGTPFLLVPVSRRALLNDLKPDMEALGAFLSGLPEPVEGLYAWTRDTVWPEAAVHARCFCPTAGLPEDPVTGTASGALGAYFACHGLQSLDSDGSFMFETEQGHAMGRAGSVQVIIGMERGTVTGVQVRGRAVLVAEGTLWA